jgi:hypothetical protein
VVNLGYKFQLLELLLPPKSNIWNRISKGYGIPKVNNLYWTTVHGRLLTLENLEKRVIQGPSRCVLCKNLEENHCHLFFDCPYTKKVWKQAFTEIEIRLVLPHSWKEMFTTWHKKYIGNFLNEHILKRVGLQCQSLSTRIYGSQET